MPLSIIFADEHLVAINKPSGMLVHRSPIDKYETRFAVQTLRDQVGRHVYPVHRLDKPTSGVLLFTFDREITQAIAQQWQHVEKRYLAITRGRLHDTALNHPIRTISETNKSTKHEKHLDENDEKGKSKNDEKIQAAETHFKALAQAQLPTTFGKHAAKYQHTTFSLVDVQPKTGRKHQIRKHLKHLNHPIVGDTCYGRGEINRYFRKDWQLNRLLLHCQQMRLIHPVTAQPLVLYAPLDNAWRAILGRFHWQFINN